ncbi:MAG: ribosome maturation factor RimP [Devosia sp.]|nr:ribosome maturation factor RimP [Devosia sp.]
MTFDLTEKRYIKETGLEQRIARIVEPVANDLGYSLVRVKMTQENGLTLQIMAEDGNGRFNITDCERLSKDVSPVLDVEDPIDREYHLEVSSPGIDRPLVRARDFAAYVGHEAKVELSDLLDGRRRFRGLIKAVDGDHVVITLPDVPKGTEPDFRLPLSMLAEAKLVMTDKLMNLAQVDQEEFPIDDDEDIETVELSDDSEADPAEDTADHSNTPEESEEDASTEETH